MLDNHLLRHLERFLLVHGMVQKSVSTSGGTGLTSIAKGSVLVANSANTLSALDGGGVDDGVLFYTASSDTLSFATSIDGGTF